MLGYFLTWFLMLLVSVANGALRDFTYGRHLTELQAHQASTLIGIVLLGAVMFAFVKLRPPASGREALGVGLLWMGMTVAFEFLFFHYVAGHPWSELLANYDLLAGRLWVLLLAWVAVGPWVFFSLRRRG